MKDQTFEQGAPFLDGHRPELLLRAAHDAWVDPEELWMLTLAHAKTRLKGGQALREKRVLENLDVALHRGSGHAAVAAQTGNVDDLAVAESGHGQEPHEAGKVSHVGLGLNLLADVKVDVALEHRPPLRACPRGNHERQCAFLERACDLEVIAHLVRGEGIHRLAQRSAGEQVGSCGPELPGARAKEGEPEPSRLDEAVDFVQNRGDALDLVDHHE